MRLLHKYLCHLETVCGESIVNWIDPLRDGLYKDKKLFGTLLFKTRL
jgi:hypothetical protein